MGHDLVLKYSDFFCINNQTIIDIGCSTGLLLNKLAQRHLSKKELLFYGVEAIKDIADFATKTVSDDRVSIVNERIEEFQFTKSNLITSYYTTQFISSSIRQQVINSVYNSLDWGGAFILFEKVRANVARFQDYANQTYMDFEIYNDFKENEIINKSRSLKGVMEPFSSQANIDALNRAGFVDISSIFKWVCFEGFIAIK